MTFKAQLVCMFFPGFLVIVIGGVLVDALPGFGAGLAAAGFLLLIAWPIFSITVHIRHERKLKRRARDRQSAPVAITTLGTDAEAAETPVHDPLHTFVSAVEFLTFTFAIPVAILGGLGIYCLVTAGEGPDKAAIKAFAGIGSLGLLGAYLLILLRGRSVQTLRVIGVALAVFGLAGTFAVAAVLGDGGATSVGDVVMAVASVVMVAAGIWLAITGRNTFTRAD